MPDLVNMRFCVVRQESLKIAGVAVISVKVHKHVADENEFKKHLKKALSEWFSATPEGWEAWQDSGEDFNIGDLSMETESPGIREILSNFGIFDLRVEILSGSLRWEYDDILGEIHQTAVPVMWQGKSDNNNGLIYGIEYTTGLEIDDCAWFSSEIERDQEIANFKAKNVPLAIPTQ